MNIFKTSVSPKVVTVFPLLVVVFPIILLFSCASNSPVPDSELESESESPINPSLDNDSPEALIATDLVSALIQLRDYAPFSTTFSVSKPSSSYGINIESALRLSGYGVQRVTADQGEKYVSYRKSDIVSNDGSATEYSVNVGRLSISRRYEIDNEQAFPISPIEIVGVPPQKVILNNDIYRQSGGNRVLSNGVIFKSPNGRTLEVDEYNYVLTDGAKASQGELFNHQRFLVIAKSRLYLDSKLSSSVDVREWQPIRQVLLVFPTKDNLYLGAKNKSAIKKLMEFYDPETTGFSITGCKGNSSLLWDGTESDSLERQLRIRNELLVAGVDINRVRENGCFANEFDSQLTKNSVLVTLRQRR